MAGQRLRREHLEATRLVAPPAYILWYIRPAMTPKVSDTHPEVEKVQIALLRSMPAWRKFQLINDIIMTGRQLALAGLRDRFPDASPQELRRRLATKLLGADLARRVYGPEPYPPTLR